MHINWCLRSESIAAVYALNSLEHHQDLHSVYSSVEVCIATLRHLKETLIIIWWSHSHSQTEVFVGIEEFHSFELARTIVVMGIENIVNVLLKHRVV